MSMLTIEKNSPVNGEVALRIEGALTVETVSELHAVLLESCREADTLVLDAEGLETIDFFGIQLLGSTRLSLEAQNKQLVWKDGMPDLIVQATLRAGCISLDHSQDSE